MFGINDWLFILASFFAIFGGITVGGCITYIQMRKNRSPESPRGVLAIITGALAGAAITFAAVAWAFIPTVLCLSIGYLVIALVKDRWSPFEWFGR